MGKLYKRYTHKGRLVKTELTDSITNTPESTLDDINSLVDGPEIVTGNKEIHKKTETMDTKLDSVPDTFEQHFSSYIKEQTANTDDGDQPEPTPQPPVRRKETYEEQAYKLGFTDLPTNLAHSLISWTRAGRPVVTAEQWNSRLSICRGCQFWSESKTNNSAKCMKCGCGSGKLLLTQSRCPLNPPKWSAL